jgi:hypothetical protein
VGQIGSVYKQPETEVDDSCHSWRVPSKWKGYKGEQGGISKGSKGNWQGRQGKDAPCIYVTVLYVQKNDWTFE